jgi:hypothetical protein
MTVATTHDVHIAYSDPSGGGAYSRITNFYSGALIRGIKFDSINDTLYMSNIRIRGLWYASEQSLVDWILGNLIGFEVGTLDNVQIYGVEFFHNNTGMLFTDQTVQGNTHSMVSGQCHGIAFNLCRHAIRIISDAVVTGTFTDVSAQGSTTEGDDDTLFLLDSDNVNLNFNGLRITATGGVAIEVGGGASGTVFINGLDIESYSDVTSGSVATITNTGATLKVGHPWSIAAAFGISPGAIFSGAGETSTGNFSEVFLNDNRLLKTDGSTGKVEETGITVDDSNNVSIPGDVEVSGELIGLGAFYLGAALTPAQITANTNNYNPTGLATTSCLRLSTDASRNLTGIAGGFEGRILTIHNIGTQNLVLVNDATSTAANRFLFGDSITVFSNQSITLRYDATSQRWRSTNTSVEP